VILPRIFKKTTWPISGDGASHKGAYEHFNAVCNALAERYKEHYTLGHGAVFQRRGTAIDIDAGNVLTRGTATIEVLSEREPKRDAKELMDILEVMSQISLAGYRCTYSNTPRADGTYEVLTGRVPVRSERDLENLISNMSAIALPDVYGNDSQ
jgi:hypothetical protein